MILAFVPSWVWVGLYGGLAITALYATWHDTDLKWIGGLLVFGWAASNILDWTVSVEWMPGPYSLIEFVVFYACALAFFANLKHWPLLILAGISILSITSNIGFSVNFPHDERQIYVWKLTTNILFAVECLIAASVGVVDGRRVGRVYRLPRLRWRNLAPDAAREGPRQ